MASASNHRWFRLHWVTWVVIAAAMWRVLDFEFEQHNSGPSFGNGIAFVSVGFSGWPFSHCYIESVEMVAPLPGIPASGQSLVWRPWKLIANGLISIVLIGSTAVVCETIMRSNRRGQFGLRQLLGVIGIVALLLGLTRCIWQDEFRGMNGTFTFRRELIDWYELKHPIRWPFLVSLACTIYSLGWLAFWLFGRAYSRIATRRR